MLDHCVYFRNSNDGDFVYLLLLVNDILIASVSSHEITRLKSKLSDFFEMKGLGLVKKILGNEILRERESCTMKLSQQSYSF